MYKFNSPIQVTYTEMNKGDGVIRFDGGKTKNFILKDGFYQESQNSDLKFKDKNDLNEHFKKNYHSHILIELNEDLEVLNG